MIQVIHVVPRPDGGGAERLVRELTERLPSHGIETSGVYFTNPRSVILSERESELGLRGPRDPRAIGRVRSKIRELLRADKWTMVHGHLTWPLYFLPPAVSGLGVTTLFTEHNTQNRRRKYPVLRGLERLVYGRYQRIACISDGTRESLASWLDRADLTRKVRVVPNGSRLLPFDSHPKPKPLKIRLVSVGSLSAQKGFDTGLRAVGLLGESIERYTIVGEGRQRGELEALAEDLGIREKIHFPGYVDDVTPFFHEADLAFIPSRWEGFGLVAVEALSTGLPLVASDVAGLREVLTGCSAARLVSPQEPSAFAAAIRAAKEQLVGNDLVAYAAREHSETFTTEAMVKRYAALYEEVREEIRGER